MRPRVVGLAQRLFGGRPLVFTNGPISTEASASLVLLGPLSGEASETATEARRALFGRDCPPLARTAATSRRSPLIRGDKSRGIVRAEHEQDGLAPQTVFRRLVA